MVTFEDRRKTDPQGVIDDLVKQTARQAKAIHELSQRTAELEEALEKSSQRIQDLMRSK
jgi:uncharacterized coiled-coil protein SlyX